MCGATAVRHVTSVEGGTIAACRACGSFTTLPRRSDDELAQLYDNGYFEQWLRSRPTGVDYDDALAEQEPRAAFVTGLRPLGRLLDVGAATGLFLECARRRGWEVDAVEPSADSWAWATKHFPLPCAAISLFDVDPTPQFDAVCFWHSLEHFAEPMRALSHAASTLTRGGAIIIECPNAASLDRRVRRARWSGWHLPFHTVHFTPRGLRAALQGLELDVEPVRHALWPPVAGMARRALRLGRHGGSGGDQTPLPFLLRQEPGSPAARVARLLSGREMLVVARRR